MCMKEQIKERTLEQGFATNGNICFVYIKNVGSWMIFLY